MAAEQEQTAVADLIREMERALAVEPVRTLILTPAKAVEVGPAALAMGQDRELAVVAAVEPIRVQAPVPAVEQGAARAQVTVAVGPALAATRRPR